ncbi:hypothetical protein [Haloferax mucosum]|uniref:hypothetical protein n=1 Tax=Haloferax mucosum TaxID=403181 RepID=UPI0013755B7E|nr:hypothetical protein [Haloferax mucosum]
MGRGPRSGELQDLSIGDITDHEYGLQATFNGKTGRRTVMLIPSVPHVRQWLRSIRVQTRGTHHSGRSSPARTTSPRIDCETF